MIVENKEIKFVQDWSEVTIAVWKELNSVESEYEISKKIEQMSILTDTDPQYIRSLSMKEFNEFSSKLGILNKPLPREVVTTFKLGNKEYGIIPDFNYISAGEWIDAENWKDKPIDNIHLYAALIFRPIVSRDEDTWVIEPHTTTGFMTRAEKFERELPISTIYGSVLFFSALGIGLMKSLEESLTILQNPTEMKKMKKKRTSTATKKRK